MRGPLKSDSEKVEERTRYERKKDTRMGRETQRPSDLYIIQYDGMGVRQ